jgi:hypothetical protein
MTTWVACWDACASGLPRTWHVAHILEEGIANAGAEIRKGQAVQTLQLYIGRVLQGTLSPGTTTGYLLTLVV